MRFSVRRVLLIALGIGVLAGVGLVGFGRPILYRLATRFIVVDDRPEPADLIYVLNGAYAARVSLAARLYHEGYAPRVLLAHNREKVPARYRPARTLSELIASLIVGQGVPDTAVTIIPFPVGVENTWDEGRALRLFLERAPVRRVIVVTTDYHTGRALRTLRRELRGLRVELRMAAAAAGRGFTRSDWWESEAGRRTYTGELVKQIGVILGVGRARDRGDTPTY